MNKEYNYPCQEPCSSIRPNSVDLCVDKNVCKVRADVTIDRVRSVLIWGCVTDCYGSPVSGVLVKLLKYTGCEGDLKEISRTYTDCQGRYQFDLENGCEGRYRVYVSQSVCSEPEKPDCHCHKPYPDCDPYENYCHSNTSHGCKSVSRNNVQYY